MMNPLYINIEDISNVLFDMIIGVSNFNAQQIAFGHMVENWDIDTTLDVGDEVVFEGDMRDYALQHMQ